MAFLDGNRRFGRPERLGFDGVAPVVVATSDGGAVVSWASNSPRHSRLPAGQRPSRRLFAARLPAGSRHLGRPFEISLSSVAGAGLAAGPDGVVVATWASRGSPRGLLAAQIAPRRGPVRVIRPGLPKATAAPLAIGPNGSAVATVLAPSRLRPPGSGAPGDFDEGDGQWIVSGTVAGGFGPPSELPTTLRPPLAGTPSILPTGEALVALSQQDGSVLVASRPAGAGGFAPPETLATARQAFGRSPLVTLAQAAEHVLVAWPGPRPRGGMVIAERP